MKSRPRRPGRRLVAFVLETAARYSPARTGASVVYHRIADRRGDPARELVPALDLETFAMQVRYLRTRYRVVPASRLHDEVRARRRGRRVPISITFDDDLLSHASLAGPILRAHGTPATFFLCGASLERPWRFWWERLQDALDAGMPLEAVVERLSPSLTGSRPTTIHELARRIERLSREQRRDVQRVLGELAGPDPVQAGLRTAQIRALISDDFEIGFHTLRHDPLPTLTDAELAGALVDGMEALQALTGQPIDTIAYPHGAADERVAAAAAAAGFSSGFTTRAAGIMGATSPLLMGRLTSFAASREGFAMDVARAARGARRVGGPAG